MSDVSGPAMSFLDAALGTDVFSRVERAFAFMAIAHEEIDAARRALRAHTPEGHRVPLRLFKGRDTRIRESFPALFPGVLGDGFLAPWVYRAHCRELIARTRDGESLEPASDAELLVHCSRMSLKAPPSEDFSAFMERLFLRIAPDKARTRIGAAAFRESYAGRLNEIEREMRNRFRTTGRK